MITKFNTLKKYFWRGLYCTVVDIETTLHKADQWMYKKVDYPFFVKGGDTLIGVARQPFRLRA